MYLFGGIRSQRAGTNESASTFPPSYTSCGAPSGAVVDDLAPHHVAVALGDRVRAAELVRLLRVERGMNAAEHDPGAALAREPADFVAAQRVSGVDADADHVAGLDPLGVEHLQRFVSDDGVAEVSRRRSRQHVKPARRDDADAEREMAGIDEVNAQKGISSTAGFQNPR